MNKPDIILCEHCIAAIRSRGEKVIKGDSLYYSEDFDEDKTHECEWCKEEFEPSNLYECWF